MTTTPALDRRQALIGAAAAAGLAGGAAQARSRPWESSPVRRAADDGRAEGARGAGLGAWPGGAGPAQRDRDRGGRNRPDGAGRSCADAGATPLRLAAMTKPVTAIAALMLVEDGKLRVDEPVERLAAGTGRPPGAAHPRLAGRRHGAGQAADHRRADVLTFRLGWGVLFDPDLPVHKSWSRTCQASACRTRPRRDAGRPPDRRTVPLMAQPGERWLYTVGSNVLGAWWPGPRAGRWTRSSGSASSGPLGMTNGLLDPAAKGRPVTGYIPRTAS